MYKGSNEARMSSSGFDQESSQPQGREPGRSAPRAHLTLGGTGRCRDLGTMVVVSFLFVLGTKGRMQPVVMAPYLGTMYSHPGAHSPD